MSDRQLGLTQSQINEIKNRVAFDESTGTFDGANSWKAYEYISNLIEDSNQVDDNTKVWFERASEINKNDPKSAANIYIRSVTENGLKWDGQNASAQRIQETSNNIGLAVINDIVANNGIAQLDKMLAEDISAALGKGGQKIGGWGGSFYYWDLEVALKQEDGTFLKATVGEHILGDKNEYEKFIAVNAAAVDTTFAKEATEQAFVFESEFADMGWFGFGSALPFSQKALIMGRALGTSGEESYAADPNRIGEWIFNEQTSNWVRASGNFAIMGFQTATGEVATELNEIRSIRLQKQDVSKFGLESGTSGLNLNQSMFDYLYENPSSSGFNYGVQDNFGTDFDTSSYGFDIGTFFSYGNEGQGTQEFGSDFSSILNDGLLLGGGNWSVSSVTANNPGFWVEMNAAISDGFQPGRGNVIGTTASTEISSLWNDASMGSWLTDPIDVHNTVLSTSWLTNWSLNVSEIDPLVLDLDGDGIELTPFGDHYVFFDIDNDGRKERTGWVGGDDGILVHDLNGDGQITDVTEMLSEYYGAPKGTGAIYGSSFDALKTLDSNDDGKINAQDTHFNSLRLWQDANHNGVTDEGELKSLTERGIVELSLNDTADGSFTGGNEVKSNAIYRKGDGSLGAMAAVNFIADPSGLIQEADGVGTRIELEDGAATYSVGDVNGETVDAATKGVANLIGGVGDDVLVGDAQNNWLLGSLGEDQLYGGAGNDYLVADAADLAHGQGHVQGGDGFDVIQFVGETGVLFNLQESQVEMAIGTDEADILASGSSDPSIINGGGGHDVILGGSAGDVLNGEEGNDTIYGYHGNDLIRGHRGEDRLIGGEGNDILQGGLGSDTLSGGVGEDLLDGGVGDDFLDGGEGYDVAQYSGSYGDYTVTANENGTYTVTDRREGSPDGTDTLKNVEALNFADIHEVQMDGDHPLPVKDVVRVNAEEDGKTYRIAISDLLANDLDYQADRLSLREAFDATGGLVWIDGDEIVFVVDDGFSGIPSFSYRIADEHGNNGLSVGVTGTDLTAEMTAKVTLVLDDHPQDPQFLDQWYLPEINVLPVWEDYTGAGVKVGIFEPGPWDGEDYGQIDYSHPDLLPNIDPHALHIQNPNIEPTQHATLVAGVIGAARNEIGGVGVAYGVTLASEGVRESDLSPLLRWSHYDIANNSWGPEDQFGITAIDEGGHSVTSALLENAVRFGRDGLGTIVVMAGGNSRAEGHDTNTSDLTNNRYGITVGAINAEGDLGHLQIAQDPFSNPGSSILVSAPGSNVTSTSRLVENDNGSTFGNDYETTQGTSFAAPIVSGVVALMLEANPLLGWRDVQEILALSAKQIEDPNTHWKVNGAVNWNGGGMHYSHDYGFGLVDAHAAVRLAETWTKKSTLVNEVSHAYQSGALNAAIPDGSAGISHTLSVTDRMKIENVEVRLHLQHSRLGDVEVVLTGPDGTESILINRPGVAPSGGGEGFGVGAFDQVWSTATTHHWGENSAGDWTLTVRDKVTGQMGVLRDWELTLYGERASENNTYFYTDEFARLGDQGRATLDDQAGYDVINASAVTGDVVIDLSGERANSIAGRDLSIADGAVIEGAYGGDGDDVLYGNGAVNTLAGGRGNDILHAYFEPGSQITGNPVYLAGDKQVRSLDAGVDILSINDTNDFYVTDTSVGISFFNGALVATGSNHFTGFDLSKDRIDLSAIETVTSFDDLILSNRITLNNTTWAGISTEAGGMILLAGIDAADLTASHFLFAGQVHGDTLLGGAGDDTLYASQGDDVLDGGTGNDRLVYDGARSRYVITVTEQGFTVTDTRNGSSDRVTGIEIFEFDGKSYTQQQLINYAPVTEDVDLGRIDEDTSMVITQEQLLANNTDINGDTVNVISLHVDPAIGVVSNNNDGSWTFTPTEHFHGQAVTFDFIVSDGQLETAAQAHLDIEAVNDAPDAQDNDGYTTGQNQALTISATDLLGNDVDIDGDTLTVTAVEQAVNGSVVLNQNGDVIFTPDAGYSGNASFIYTVCDGMGGTATASVRISISASSEENSFDLENFGGMIGTDGDDTLRGGFADDRIMGGKGDDILDGSFGDDTLMGGEGNDTLRGFFGDDIFLFADHIGHDRIKDFTPGASSDDTLCFQSRFSSYDDVMAAARQEGKDVIIQYDDYNSITLENVELPILHYDDFCFM